MEYHVSRKKGYMLRSIIEIWTWLFGFIHSYTIRTNEPPQVQVCTGCSRFC